MHWSLIQHSIKEGVLLKKVFRNPDVMWREEEDSLLEASAGLEKGNDVTEVGTSLLFSDGIMITLNLMGTEIWKICDGRTVEEIIDSLLADFEVERAVLSQDVHSFLQDLEQKGFIFYG